MLKILWLCLFLWTQYRRSRWQLHIVIFHCSPCSTSVVRIVRLLARSCTRDTRTCFKPSVTTRNSNTSNLRSRPKRNTMFVILWIKLKILLNISILYSIFWNAVADSHMLTTVTGIHGVVNMTCYRYMFISVARWSNKFQGFCIYSLAMMRYRWLSYVKFLRNKHGWLDGDADTRWQSQR